MLPHPLNNFKINLYYENKRKSIRVDSKNILPKRRLKHIINLDEYESIENRWIDLSVNGDNPIYFDKLRVE